MKGMFILFVMFTTGCVIEPGMSHDHRVDCDAPLFVGGGQEAKDPICEYNVVIDHGFAACHTVVCNNEGRPEIKFKQKGWWCYQDHPNAPIPGVCDGWGSCQ